jgi:TRAP-type uncharacterized transport system fused permease subunit
VAGELRPPKQFMKDKLGVFFSGLCVVHCLIFTFIIWGGVGSINFYKTSEELIHPILLLFVILIGFTSFPSAYKNHRNPLPLIMGITGMIGLFIALFLNTFFEIILTLFFGTLLIAAHLWNHRLQN